MAIRDLLLSLLLFAALPVAIAKPFFGAVMFAWLSIMNPHRLTWSFAADFNWAFLFALATIVGFLHTPEKRVAQALRNYWPFLLYLAWNVTTTMFALEPASAQAKLEAVLKVQLMCVLTLCLLTTPQRVRVLALVIALSIAYYGTKGGVFTLLTAGAYRVWGPMGTPIQDNNALATGLVMTLPMLYWIWRYPTYPALKWVGLVCVVFTSISIFGSHSRGAFVAIVAMSGILWLKSDRKFVVAMLIAGAALVSLVSMPQQYWDRIETIQNYEEDLSAMARLRAWQTAINVANDRVTGGGFEFYSLAQMAKYSPTPTRVHSSHSIYFQSLGEHGWIGLGLFLLMWLHAWRHLRKAARALSQSGEAADLLLLTRMLQVSMIGFLVGGTFLNIGNWDFVYYQAIIALALSQLSASSATVKDRTHTVMGALYRHTG